MKAIKFAAGIGIFTALALTACGGGGGSGDGGATASGGAAGGASTLEVGTDASGNLVFVPTSLTATADQPITVNFKNPAPVQHNFVLVEAGQEQAVADAAAAKNGDATGLPGVIATGGVLDANGSESFEVPAQAAGSIPYICTVPGHFAAGMKGTLTVE